VILRIWKQSMQPLLAALQAWLYDGLLQGSPYNFFICEGESKLHFINYSAEGLSQSGEACPTPACFSNATF